jgi:hypothetical protein
MSPWLPVIIVAVFALVPLVSMIDVGRRHPGGRLGYLKDVAITNAGGMVFLALAVTSAIGGDRLTDSSQMILIGVAAVSVIGALFLPPVRAARRRMAGCYPAQPMQYGDEAR